jgi:hypothetical protein
MAEQGPPWPKQGPASYFPSIGHCLPGRAPTGAKVTLVPLFGTRSYLCTPTRVRPAT